MRNEKMNENKCIYSTNSKYDTNECFCGIAICRVKCNGNSDEKLRCPHWRIQ